MMHKIAVIGIYSEYYEYTEIDRTDLIYDWTELTTSELALLQKRLDFYNVNRYKFKDNVNKPKSLRIISHETPLTLESLLEETDILMVKEAEAQEKKKIAQQKKAKENAEKAKERELEKKRKQLEKLKLELGDE